MPAAPRNPRRPKNIRTMSRELDKPISEFTDGELADCGRIRVPVGPFGLFGTKIMTIKTYNAQQARKAKAAARRKAKRAANRKKKAKKVVKRVVTGKKSKKRRWIIPGLIYWD
jgi:hypothetical protein